MIKEKYKEIIGAVAIIVALCLFGAVVFVVNTNVAHASEIKIIDGIEVNVHSYNIDNRSDLDAFLHTDLEATITVNEKAEIIKVEDGTHIVTLPQSRDAKIGDCTNINSCWFVGQIPYTDIGFVGNGTTNGDWPGRGSYRTYDRWSSIYFTNPNNGDKLGVENIDHNKTVGFSGFYPTGTAVVLW